MASWWAARGDSGGSKASVARWRVGRGDSPGRRGECGEMEGLRGATRSASRASAASVRLWRLCSPRRAVECGENAMDRAALGCAAERVWRVQGLRGLSRLCVGFSGFRAHSCVELGSCVCECGNFSAVGCALVCCTSECGELKVLQTHTLVGPEAERHRSEIHRVWREHDRKTVGNGTKQAKPQRIRDYNCSAGGSECGPKVERVVVHTRGRSSSPPKALAARPFSCVCVTLLEFLNVKHLTMFFC